MRLVHNWSETESKTVKALYGLKTKYTFKNKEKSEPKYKDYHRIKACPVDGRRAAVMVLWLLFNCA